MRLFLKSINIVLLSILSLNTIFSQVDISFDLSSEFDDNVFLSPDPTNDFLTDASLKFILHPKDTALKYFFNTNYFSYLDNNDRNIFINNAGFSYYKRIGQGNNYLIYGGEWLNRLNKEEYNYYNYNQVSGYSNIMFRFDQSTLKTGYNIRYRSYSNLRELTNFQQYLFMNFNKSLPTRTTFIFETNLGLKTFKGVDTYTNGTGRGRNNFSQIIDGDNSNLGHIIILGRIAQSIGTKQGVFLQFRRQIGIYNSFDYTNSDEFYQDEELFDDPFSYESSELSTQISFLLPHNYMLRTGGILSFKDYISELAYENAEDSVGTGSLRQDTKNNFFINIAKEYYPKNSWYKSIRFYTGYSLIFNKSNSYWYDYKNNTFNFGLTLTF